MAAAITFHAGEGFTIHNLSGSGLGLYGAAGFAASVSVGAWQGRTFITNGAGTTQGPEVDNVQYLNSASGILGQSGSGIHLKCIPNYQATLNIRFTNDVACRTQNVQLRIFDRVSENNAPSGVTCAVAEIVHPDPSQTMNGSGSSAWVFPAGDDIILYLTDSPGTSGLRPNGSSTTDTQHDWYAAISASPNSIGSKTNFGLYLSLEYL